MSQEKLCDKNIKGENSREIFWVAMPNSRMTAKAK